MSENPTSTTMYRPPAEFPNITRLRPCDRPLTTPKQCHRSSFTLPNALYYPILTALLHIGVYKMLYPIPANSSEPEFWLVRGYLVLSLVYVGVAYCASLTGKRFSMDWGDTATSYADSEDWERRNQAISNAVHSCISASVVTVDTVILSKEIYLEYFGPNKAALGEFRDPFPSVIVFYAIGSYLLAAFWKFPLSDLSILYFKEWKVGGELPMYQLVARHRSGLVYEDQEIVVEKIEDIEEEFIEKASMLSDDTLLDIALYGDLSAGTSRSLRKESRAFRIAWYLFRASNQILWLVVPFTAFVADICSASGGKVKVHYYKSHMAAVGSVIVYCLIRIFERVSNIKLGFLGFLSGRDSLNAESDDWEKLAQLELNYIRNAPLMVACGVAFGSLLYYCEDQKFGGDNGWMAIGVPLASMVAACVLVSIVMSGEALEGINDSVTVKFDDSVEL